MEKKIGLVTLYENNYGSILQCFATKTYIESLGFKCDLLYETFSRALTARVYRKITLLLKCLFHPTFLYCCLRRKKNNSVDLKNPVRQTRELMNVFVQDKIQPLSVDKKTIKKIVNLYDYFITGSDQVWNVSFRIDEFRFLSFSSRKKRIALAASFGVSEIPCYHKRKLKKLLNGFDYVSVRENEGVSIVKEYASSNVVQISDPTLMFSGEEWRAFLGKKDFFPSEKYILVHFLNEPNDIALESVLWVSKKLKLTIVVIGYSYEKLKKLNQFIFLDGGPEEYVSLISRAEYVFTDSFHSTLFSINLGIKFFTFNRQYLYKTQSVRVVELLDKFNMRDRLVDNLKSVATLYLDGLPTQVKMRLEYERATIRDYVRKSISGQISQFFLQKKEKND